MSRALEIVRVVVADKLVHEDDLAINARERVFDCVSSLYSGLSSMLPIFCVC